MADSITLRIPEDLRKWARVAAAQRDISLSEFVRELMEAARRKARS